jgi:LysM domain
MSVQTRGRTRLLPDVARGTAATLGVLVLVVGVPVGLILWIGSPLPAEVPTLDEIADSVRDAYIPDQFLIKALAIVCWLIWVELVVSVLVEAVAYTRGRQAERVPLTAPGIQRAAARLVATAALLGALAATRGLPQIPNRPLRPPETVTLVVEEAPDQQEAEPDLPGQAPTPAPIYEVQRRDTLWGIAENHLGDPFRWGEIYELNRGRPQADGRTLRDPDLILPGWQLELPPDATGLGNPDAGAEDAPAPTAPTAPAAPADPAADSQVLEVDIAVGAESPKAARPYDASPTGQGGMVLLPDDQFREGDQRALERGD